MDGWILPKPTLSISLISVVPTTRSEMLPCFEELVTYFFIKAHVHQPDIVRLVYTQGVSVNVNVINFY